MLARLLKPDGFGTYAVAFASLTMMQTFNDLGLSMAIVRWESDPKEIVPTVTTVSVFVSVVAYVGCFIAAPAYASAMGAPAATGVIRVLAFAIVIDGFVNTPNGLLQRSFQHGKRTIAIQAGWLGAGVTIALALSGYGAMSLAIGQLVSTTITAALLTIFAPGSLRFGFNRADARMLFRFGLPLAGSNFMDFAVTNVDKFFVGHMLGATALGYYVLAFNLAGWPLNIFSRPIRSVFPAVFARLQHDGPAMRRTFLSSVGLLASVALPACLLIAGSARPLIGFVYGTSWLPAAQPLVWLCLLSAIRILLEPAYDYLVILTRTRFLLIVEIAWLLVLIPALIGGTRVEGISGTGLAEAAVAACVALPCYLGGLKSTSISLRGLVNHLWLPFLGAAVTWAAAVEAAKRAPRDFVAVAGAGVMAAAVVGLLIYRTRRVLAMLRPSTNKLGDSAAAQATADIVDQVPDTGTWTDEMTEELAARWGVIEAPAARIMAGDKKQQAFRPGPFARSGWTDITGPLPIYLDSQVPVSRQDSPTSPLYWKTVVSRQWNPAQAVSRDV